MYKKLRFYIRFLSAVFVKYKPAILLTLFITVVGIVGIPYLIRYSPKFRSIQRIGLVGRYTLSTLPLSVQQQISTGLTTIDSSGLPSPALAKSWTATDSGTTYIFNIDTSLKWQDGQTIKSTDIQYNFKDAQIDYPDSSHLRLKLSDPFSPLPAIVSKPVFKYVKSHNIFTQPLLIGVGKYRMESYRRNGNYIDNLTLAPLVGNSNLPRIKYYFYTSPANARTAFKLGLVDTLEDLPDLSDLSHWPDTSSHSAVLHDRYVAVFFNTQDPQFIGSSGRNLRMALSYAIDKNRWPYRAVGPIPPDSWVGQPTSLRLYEKDIAKAKSFLEKVEKVPPSLTLSTVPSYLDVAEAVKSDWAALGINVEIQVQPDLPENFQALVFAQVVPTDPDQYNLWHSTQTSTNLTQLNNPRIDKILEDGRKTFDLKQRKNLYQDFQRYLLEEAPAVFLFYPQKLGLTRN